MKHNRKINALILGVGSNVSQGIIKSIRSIKGIDVAIIGACVSEISTGLYFCDEGYICPQYTDMSFVDWYIEFCNKHRIDIVFTGVEGNVDILLRNKRKIQNECTTFFLYPNEKVWKVGADKFLTCQWLREHDCNFPFFADSSIEKEVDDLIKYTGFPLIVKPKLGKSSHGVVYINNENDLEYYRQNDYVIEECVGTEDEEYTVGCYFDKKGELKSHIIFHRYIKNGTTVFAEVVSNQHISSEVRHITSQLDFCGPINMQFRMRDNKTPVCIEWNVRHSGATAMREHFGFRDVEAVIREYLFQDNIEDCFNITQGIAVRVHEEYYYNEKKAFPNI